MSIRAGACLWPAAALLLACAAADAQDATPPPAPAHTAASAEAGAQAAADAVKADDSKADAAKPENGKPEDAKAADGSTKTINLNGVTVQGKRNPLEDTDKHLKQLQDALPCNGCDATPHTHKKLVKRVVDAIGERVLPTEAPDHSTRDPNDKAQEFSQQNLCSAANTAGCQPDNLKP